MLGENKTASHFFFVAKYSKPLANESAYAITDAGAAEGQQRISIAHTGDTNRIAGAISSLLNTPPFNTAGMSQTMDTIQESAVSSGCISSISAAAVPGLPGPSASSAGSLAGA